MGVRMCPQCGRMDDDYVIMMYGKCSYCRAYGKVFRILNVRIK